MRAEQFTYPAHNTTLLAAYDGRFESVLIVPHPFISLPFSLAWNKTREYPSDEQILAQGTKYPWSAVAAETGLGSCARVCQALLTSIGSLPAHLADPAAMKTLQSFLETQPIWMPTEGRFEPLLRADFLRAFALARAPELIFVPEFPQSDPVLTLPIAKLRNGSIPFPPRGTLLAPDHSFLFTVDWDSFFTLFYGPRELVTSISTSLNLEGFFAAPTTEHAWFNYSMGCSTATLSPEHWQNI
ncbi:MAG TPA: DUF2711 family protein [Terracidiphilus sp.]|nr:DUF2711 family protein [Terracidiphilus sp.]